MSAAVILFLSLDDGLVRRVADLMSGRGVTVTRGSGLPLPADVPDLLLVDAALPEPDASTIVRIVKAERAGLPVVVVAPRSAAEAAVAAARAGADDVLFQPLDPLGTPARLQGLLNQAALEEAREHAQSLEFRNQELESFIYIVTHDMKTPVVNLQGLVGLVEQDHAEALPAEVREYLVRLRRNAERLEELLRDLLEYPRTLRIVGQLEPHDTSSVANVAVDGLQDLARSHGVEIAAARDMPVASCDAKRLQQVFHNLVENGIKHSKGRPAPRVEVGWSPTPRGPLFHVRDNGPGIPSEHLQDVFKLFHRIPGTTVNGSGIGLAVARQLVEAHGGEIWCESRVGEGTTFLFTLGQ